MKYLFIFIVLLILFQTKGLAQSQVEIPLLTPLIQEIDSLLEAEGTAGLMLGIVRSDTVLFTGGFGYADIEKGRLVDEKTLFRMGSVTKMFVSLGILKLVEEGKLNLKDELKVVAPEISFTNPWEQSHPIRIIHLLEHSTGFDDIKLNAMYHLGPPQSSGMKMLSAHQASLVSRWQPGERHSYSNPNYTVLGYIIEKISGKPYEVFLAEKILEPLGMELSHFGLNSQNPDLETHEYIIQNGKATEVPSVTSYSGPPGALWSNAAEMSRFLQMLLKNGDSIIQKESITEMESPSYGLSAKLGNSRGYGLGNHPALIFGKHPFQGHNGLTGTCFAACYYARDLDIGFVFANNSNVPTWRIEGMIVDYLLHEFEPEPEPVPIIPLDEEAISPYLGMYQFDSPRNQISAFSNRLSGLNRLSIKDKKLWLKPLNGEIQELIPTGPLKFRVKGMNIPLVMFREMEDGKKVLAYGGAYYEKVSGWGAWSWRIGLLIPGLFVAFSFILAGMGIWGKMKKGMSAQVLLAASLPFLALLLFALSAKQLAEIQQFTYLMYELGSINLRTLTIFIGTAVFGLFPVLSLGLGIWNFRKISPKWLAIYLVATGVSMCILAGYLGTQGWIAMRTWAM